MLLRSLAHESALVTERTTLLLTEVADIVLLLSRLIFVRLCGRNPLISVALRASLTTRFLRTIPDLTRTRTSISYLVCRAAETVRFRIYDAVLHFCVVPEIANEASNAFSEVLRSFMGEFENSEPLIRINCMELCTKVNSPIAILAVCLCKGS